MKSLCTAGLILVAAISAFAQSRPASQPAFRGVTYHRTGGFAGTDDRITITPDGKITISGKLVGKGEAQLTPDQIAKLLELFAGWDKLNAAYKPTGVVHDGFETEIRYGDKAVTHSDGAEDVPESLLRVLRDLPELANSITRPGK